MSSKSNCTLFIITSWLLKMICLIPMLTIVPKLESPFSNQLITEWVLLLLVREKTVNLTITLPQKKL